MAGVHFPFDLSYPPGAHCNICTFTDFVHRSSRLNTYHLECIYNLSISMSNTHTHLRYRSCLAPRVSTIQSLSCQSARFVVTCLVLSPHININFSPSGTVNCNNLVYRLAKSIIYIYFRQEVLYFLQAIATTVLFTSVAPT